MVEVKETITFRIKKSAWECCKSPFVFLIDTLILCVWNFKQIKNNKALFLKNSQYKNQELYNLPYFTKDEPIWETTEFFPAPPFSSKIIGGSTFVFSKYRF